jgi:hypothetical protein
VPPLPWSIQERRFLSHSTHLSSLCRKHVGEWQWITIALTEWVTPIRWGFHCLNKLDPWYLVCSYGMLFILWSWSFELSTSYLVDRYSYCLSHISISFCFGYFWDRVSHFSWDGLDFDPPTYASHIAGMTGMYTRRSFLLLLLLRSLCLFTQAD